MVTEKWIYDERVGCAAVYKTPKENCLMLPESRFLIYYSFPKDENDLYVPSEEKLKLMKECADSLNKSELVKAQVQEWLNKQGHDSCWYYPDVFTEIAKTLDIEIKNINRMLPVRKEFNANCEKFECDVYRQAARRRVDLMYKKHFGAELDGRELAELDHLEHLTGEEFKEAIQENIAYLKGFLPNE